MLAGSGLVGVANLVYNVVTARMLGPTGFAHVTAVYTLLMLASAITLSFQAVCAKYVASHEH
jgi:O-antigen/teichoic acid export membrane protein